MHYFAYGSNMRVQQMDHRCPAAKAIGPAFLANHRFVINRRGVATIMPRHGGIGVWGVLWRVTPQCVRTLDRREAVFRRRYRRAHVRVQLDGQPRTVSVLTYIDDRIKDGIARKGYMESIVSAARNWELRPHYIRELESWQPGTVWAREETHRR